MPLWNAYSSPSSEACALSASTGAMPKGAIEVRLDELVNGLDIVDEKMDEHERARSAQLDAWRQWLSSWGMLAPFESFGSPLCQGEPTSVSEAIRGLSALRDPAMRACPRRSILLNLKANQPAPSAP